LPKYLEESETQGMPGVTPSTPLQQPPVQHQ
jgi:hypothetical protein